MRSVDNPGHLMHHTLSARVSRIQDGGTCLTRLRYQQNFIAVIQRYTNIFNIICIYI